MTMHRPGQLWVGTPRHGQDTNGAPAATQQGHSRDTCDTKVSTGTRRPGHRRDTSRGHKRSNGRDTGDMASMLVVTPPGPNGDRSCRTRVGRKPPPDDSRAPSHIHPHSYRTSRHVHARLPGGADPQRTHATNLPPRMPEMQCRLSTQIQPSTQSHKRCPVTRNAVNGNARAPSLEPNARSNL